MKTANPLFADQTPTDWGGKPCLFFMQTIMNPNPSSALDRLQVSIQRVQINTLKPYKSIEEIVNTLPENEKNRSVDDLRKFIAQDGLRGFGELREEYKVVAYSGISNYDRPTAMVKNQDGSVVYYASPFIEKTVKRL